MKIYAYIISICLLLLASSGHSQTVDSVKKVLHLDTIKGKFIPTGVRIGADLISAGQAFFNDGYEYQFSADIDFYRYFFNIEYGVFDKQWLNSQGEYSNNGVHFKLGPDINFLQRDPDKSALFFGLRYAFSKFSDKISYQTDDGYWGTGNNSDSNNNIKADWFELTTGLKVRIYKFLWLGYTARFKFGIDKFEENQLIPHWIPGYGRGDETSFWGVDYWLIVRIPVRKNK